MKVRAAILSIALLLPLLGAAAEASRLAKRARKALAADQVAQAYLLYSQASLLDPGNRKYRGRAEALRTRAALAANALPLELEDASPAPPPVETYFDNFTARELAAAGELKPPPALRANPGKLDIDLDGDFKTLFERVAKLFGLDCVFDGGYEPGSRIRFRVTGSDYRDALFSLSAATGSFVIPVSEKVFLVARDTPQKRTDLEQTISVTVPIPQALTTQELIELAQVVRQAAGIEKLSWDNKTGSIVMRDRVSRVLPAQAILRDLFAYRPQVMVELQVIEIRKSDVLNYGVNLPNVFNIAFTGVGGAVSTATGVLPSNTSNPYPFNSRTYTFISLASQGGAGVVKAMLRGLYPTSLSLYSIGIAEANAMLNFSASLGRTILTASLRATDGQASTFHLGDKYPILTGSYSTGAAVSSQYVPTPSFTFEDLGIVLKVTPRVHGMDGVSLDVESEFKVLSGASNDGNPVISNRKFKSLVDLTNGEWAVVAGLTQDTVSRTVSGTRGISAIPLLGRLLSQTAKQKDKSEILILMRPRPLDLPGNQMVTQDIRVGTETRPYSPL